ncbi:hypothetical protein FRC03_002247 [Tulasnella sp. 419]|nr:hypothetical protein FRC03_002247 [Tulasnella sp. 419]
MASLTEPLDPEILSAVHTTLSQLQGQLDRISYHALNTAIRGLVELIIIVIRGPISNDELKMLNVQLEELLDVTTTIVEDLVIGHRPETLSSDIQGVHESCSRLLLRHRRSGSLIYVEGSPVATLIEGINKAVSSFFRHPSSLLQEPLMPQNPPLPSNMRWRHDLASGVDLGNVCVSAIAISPDGERIATASWDNTLCLWDTWTGAQIARSATHSGEVSIVCFSQNGGFITSGSYNGTLRVWLSPNVQLALIPGPILKGHSDSISALTVTGISSNEPELIVSGSWDNTIRVWRADGDHVATLEGHDDIISSVSVSEHGEFFISSSWDKTIGVWDGRDYTLLTKVSVEATQEVVSVAYLLDGSIISGHKDDVVRQWSLLTMEMMTEQDGKLGSARQFSFTGDFSRAMSIGDNHTSSQIWGIASTSTSTILTPRLINLENPSTCECSSVAISKDGTFSVLGYSDGSIERISMEGVVDRNDSPAQETRFSSSGGSTPTILHEPFQLLSQLDEKSYDVKYFVQQVLRALRDSRAFVTQLNAEFQALHNSFDPGALDRLVELAGDAVELKRRLILMELIVQTTSADPNFYVLTSNMLTMHELVHWVHQRPYYKVVCSGM